MSSARIGSAWFIARRYLEATRRKGFLSFITIIAILGVTLGTAALIITLSVLDGFEHEIKEKVVSFTSHIEVQGYQNLPLPPPREDLGRIVREIPSIRHISAFAAREGMIRGPGGTVDGVFLKGIDPGADVLSSRRHIVEGDPMSSQGTPLLIGRKLATRLNARINDKMVVFALPRSASRGLQPKAMEFRLSGIYESGMAEFDDVYAYTTLAAAQDLFQLGGDITGYDVLVDNLDKAEETAVRLQEALGYPHYAQTVFQMYRNLFSWVELQKKLSPMLLSLIIIVATVNIIGTLLMFVLEKTRAIAVLTSLGAGPNLIRRIFTLQGLAIGAVGIFLGNALALLFCWAQMSLKILSLPADIYYMNAVPVMLRPENFVIVTLIALLLCFLTSSLPSKAAARVRPVSIFRFG